MPDGDVIKRGVRHAWRGAYESLAGGGTDADVRGLVAKALTASLRKSGMPVRPDATALVDDVWNQRVSRDDALAQAPAVVGAVGGTRQSALLELAVRRTIIAGPTGSRPDQAIAEAYLNAEVESELMAKVRPAMLESRNLDPASIEQTMTRWNEEIQEPIRRIAQQLIEDPEGNTLRAPPSRRGMRKTTAQILDESV